MFKQTLVLMGAFLCLSPIAAHGAETVKVTLPTFDVTLNEIVADNTHSQYPFIVYKDITYVPMTYHDARLLGLTTQWTEQSGLVVNKASTFDQATARESYKGYATDQANRASYDATIAEFAITVSGNEIINSEEPYPLLVFRDVTYFPLTWR